MTAERALLAALEAGCTAPVGALAEVVESLDADGGVVLELFLRAVVAAPDGSDLLRRSASGPFDQPDRARPRRWPPSCSRTAPPTS